MTPARSPLLAQGRWPGFDELAALDPEVHRSLVQLKGYEGRVADLSLDFTVETDFLGATISEELVPGGASLAVTNDNVLQVRRCCTRRL